MKVVKNVRGETPRALKSHEQFKGFVVTVSVREHTFLMFGNSIKLVKGRWYAQVILPKEFQNKYVNVLDNMPNRPSEEAVLKAVRNKFPSVRKIEFTE